MMSPCALCNLFFAVVTATNHFCRRQSMNKVLLVTGGSRGIGAATALLAAQNGWSVAVNYTANSLAADEVVRQIRASGGQAMSVQADVAEEDQVLRMFEHIDAKLGRLSGLVNNAGVVDVKARVDEMSVARLKRMFDINVVGTFVVAQEGAAMLAGDPGAGADLGELGLVGHVPHDGALADLEDVEQDRRVCDLSDVPADHGRTPRRRRRAVSLRSATNRRRCSA
jgi:NAD(P)-dependent dehydrogenase (short-subunit alcohol dehydrogenase family)